MSDKSRLQAKTLQYKKWTGCNTPYSIHDIHTVTNEPKPPNVYSNFVRALLLIGVLMFVDICVVRFVKGRQNNV
jgi:hypothetical protein